MRERGNFHIMAIGQEISGKTAASGDAVPAYRHRLARPSSYKIGYSLGKWLPRRVLFSIADLLADATYWTNAEPARNLRANLRSAFREAPNGKSKSCRREYSGISPATWWITDSSIRSPTRLSIACFPPSSISTSSKSPSRRGGGHPCHRSHRELGTGRPVLRPAGIQDQRRHDPGGEGEDRFDPRGVSNAPRHPPRSSSTAPRSPPWRSWRRSAGRDRRHARGPVGGAEGVPAKFFDADRRFPRGPFVLSRATGAPYFPRSSSGTGAPTRESSILHSSWTFRRMNRGHGG